jgi:hypothetical protein
MVWRRWDCIAARLWAGSQRLTNVSALSLGVNPHGSDI